MEGSGSGSSDDEVVFEMAQFIRVYKSGRVERYFGSDPVPSSTDAATGVASKDRAISPDVAVRLYLPPATTKSEEDNNRDGGGSNKKLPVLVYFHGGGFCLHTAFNFVFHAYLTSLAARARAVVVSVDAGANIAHHVAMRAGAEPLPHGCRISGVAAVHPYFLGPGRVASEETDPAMADSVAVMWRVVCPGTSGVDDPWINPLAADAPGLERLACARVLVCLAEKDVVRDRGRDYADALRASRWAGEVDVLEVKGQGHCFHLVDFACDDAVAQDDAIARFVNL
ncbi:hypothetical protein U9M48_014628 [Paspalum notatum var. saurae]|uniref:Alpha/beta hydrolase fold-3 domain-containing protein n=1 Tax=Paspalum notatum var. saurae TaxID=547442 RepID=A0AAQ3WKZ5_PASNO